jgi:stage V sporulation protein B
MMGAAAVAVDLLLVKVGVSSAVLRTGGGIVIAVIVYVVAVLLLKTITPEDCKLLPKGDKIAKILKIS